MMPTLEEWKQRYREKTGEEAVLAQDYQLTFDERHGFIMWKRNGQFFDIDHLCSDDHKWWRDKLVPFAKSLGCTHLRTLTKRSPAAFMRLTQCKVNVGLSGCRRNGQFYWALEKSVRDFC